jgi:signal peptidase I
VETRRLRGCLFEIAQTVALTAVVFLVLQNFVAQPYRVQMQSMAPTLQPDDHLIVDRLTPRFDHYGRGDVIVFIPPADGPRGNGTAFVKRVIALEGEIVELGEDGFVYVDGARLDEPYVRSADGLPQRTDPRGGLRRWVVPDGHLFVLGDNRRASDDSRLFGPVAVSSVVGRGWLRYWPLASFGTLPSPDYPDAAAP